MKWSLAAFVLLAAGARAQTVLFHEDFENGYANWSMEGLWNPQSSAETCTLAQTPFPSGNNCVWYGYDGPTGCNFNGPDPYSTHSLLYTPAIQLPATTGTIALRFRSYSDADVFNISDQRIVHWPGVYLGDNPQLPHVFNSDKWVELTYDITRWAGGPFQVGFTFWAMDVYNNLGLGWLIDDIEIVELPGPALTVCAGDGSWHGCPCGNNGGPGRGCASSLSATGAEMVATGTPSTAAQDLILHMDGMSPAAATVYQASVAWGQTFSWVGGDGLTCSSGSFIRLTTRFAPGGNLDFPGVSDPSIVLMGMVSPFTSRCYSARYRDSAAFCTSATFNMTNTISVTWRP